MAGTFVFNAFISSGIQKLLNYLEQVTGEGFLVDFIKTIERYWKATLIRDLLDLKGKEINKTIVVSQEEVETYYRKMQESDKDLPPFENVQENITNELTEKRRIAALKAWIDVLRENANIEINQELLANK